MAAEKLWQQYSHRTPRSCVSPGRTPRSVASATSPRSTQTSSSSRRSFVSVTDLQAQARESNRVVGLELAGLRGLIAEVSQRVSAVDACTSASASTAPGSLRASRRPSVSSTASVGSSRSRQTNQADPAVAEAAEGRRAAAPVGARHRQQPKLRDERDSGTQLLWELNQMAHRCSMAMTFTSNLISGVEELAAASARQRRPSAPPGTAARAVQGGRQRGLQAADQRICALQRSIRSRAEDSKVLCKEARALGARAMHELTATAELLELSAALDEHRASFGMCGERSLSPLERRCVTAPPWPQSPLRPALVDVDDMTLHLRQPQTTSHVIAMEPVAVAEPEPVPLERLPAPVLKRCAEGSLEECRLDSPDRSSPDKEAIKSSPAVRHVWQVQAV